MSKAIHFSIPFNLEQNNVFQNISKRQLSNKTTNRENQLFLFNIDSFYYSFPYSLWNGGINSNIDNLLLYEDIGEFQYKFLTPFRLDCSNIYINKYDFLNKYMNLLLDLFSNSGTQIELSNIDLYKYIKEKYDSYNFIFSKNADYIHPFDIDIIEQLCEENFSLISLPNRFNSDLNLLSQIKDKTKIEITICNKCLNCQSQNNCNIQEQQNQYNFMEASIYNYSICDKSKTYNINNQLEIFQEIKPFAEIGISHFRIDNPFREKTNEYYNWLLNNLFKNEFVEEVLKNG